MHDSEGSSRTIAFEAAFRSLLVAPVLALGCSLLLLISRFDLGWSTLLSFAPYPIAQGVGFAVPVGPVCVVECLARRRRPSRRRLLLVASISLIVAFASARVEPAVVAGAQVALTNHLANPVAALAAAKSAELTAIPKTRFDRVACFAWSLLFALGAALRLRSTSLSRQTAWLVGLPALVVLVGHARSHFVGPGMARYHVTMLVLCGSTLPLAASLAQAWAKRLFARLVREPPGPRPSPVSGTIRKRAPPRTLLVLAAGVALVISVHRAYVDPPRPELTPEDLEIQRGWEASVAGTLSSEETTALAERATTIVHEVRPRIGEVDPLCIESQATVRHFSGRNEVQFVTNVWIDGERRPEPLAPWGSSYGYGGVTHKAKVSIGDLREGWHEVVVESSLSILDVLGMAVVWSRSLTTYHHVHVVPGTVRGEIALLRPKWFDADFFLFFPSDRQSSPEYMWFSTEKAPVAIRSTARVFDETGRLLAEQPVRCEKGESTSIGFWVKQWDLAPGHHRMRMTVVPDPELVLDDSATMHEILGVCFQRDFTIDRP